MASFFKKAIGLFVEFEEEQNTNTPESKSVATPKNVISPNFSSNAKPVFNQADIDKFESHFDKLFDGANLPGPDYYEFWKMMETLEAHIPDEKARIAAVFASLSIQGLTKDKLVASAQQYKGIIDKDKQEFEKAVNDKAKIELDSRKKGLQDFEQKIAANSELIQKLTKEITEAQAKIAVLKKEILEEENKLTLNKGGYNIACDAMLNKINTDIQKIQTTL